MDVRVGPWRRLNVEELMLSNWCWRRLLRVPWTARRSKQSILKEISAEYSLEGLMLKLKLQYFGHLMRRADSFEKNLMLGKIVFLYVWVRPRSSQAESQTNSGSTRFPERPQVRKPTQHSQKAKAWSFLPKARLTDNSCSRVPWWAGRQFIISMK